jgi:N-acetylmuramic acid 6-phosphate etherase
MDHLPTEARNPASMNLDELTALEFVKLMNREDSQVVEAVASQFEQVGRAIEVIAERMRAGGRLIYVGAGTSGRLGVLDASECPPTFSTPPEQVVGLIAGGYQALTRSIEGAEDHPESAEQDLAALRLDARDTLVGIATSGRTPYVIGAMGYAKKLGAFVIGLACNPESEIAGLADLSITPVVGPEVLSGSTRLKAGTATKLVLNMLSTGAMVRLGKTYGNLMVDLRATNSKLRARTNRIVRLLTSISVEEADTLLAQCGGELKTALVVQRAGISVDEARARLKASGGQVRLALREAGKSASLVGDATTSHLYLGIDGGGSHSVALLARSGASGFPLPAETILARGEAGPSNIQSIGIARALQALDESVARAFAVAGLGRARVAAACLGLAGAGRPEDRQAIVDWARRVNLADAVEVRTDAEILLAAGTPEKWGLAVVAGTGSIVYGRAADGRAARAGGWGYLLDDEGSGYALVIAAFQAILRSADGRGPDTRLAPRLLDHLQLKSFDGLIPMIYQGRLDRASLARLAPLVVEVAEAGDCVASAIVEGAASELAELAAAVAAKLCFSATPVPLALAGGVLLGSAYYRRLFLSALEKKSIQAAPLALVSNTAEGAIRIALEAAAARTVQEEFK